MRDRHLLIGLGNPGPTYQKHRHNVGFMALSVIYDRHSGYTNWKPQSQCLVSDGRIDDQRTMLVMPQTYMNNSGHAVGALCHFYKLSATDVTVIYDDLALTAGKIKVKRGGGHGGHNGLRSLDQHIGPDYRRLRVGIGHPGDKALVHNYVLSNFSQDDKRWLDIILTAISDELSLLVHDNESAFVSRIMQKWVA